MNSKTPAYQATYFKPEEYLCPCCGLNNMDNDFLRDLDILRGLCGFPLVISSGCRCKEQNARVGGGNYSAHLEGVAVDIAIGGERALNLLRHALSLGVSGVGIGFTGVGIMQHGDFKRRFIHLDKANTIDGYRPRPTLWTY